MGQSKISFLLTRAELNLLESVLYLEPCLVDGIENAKAENGKHRVKFSGDDLAESLGALSYTSNCTHSHGKREELHNLYNKIKSYLTLSQGLRRSRL